MRKQKIQALVVIFVLFNWLGALLPGAKPVAAGYSTAAARAVRSLTLSTLASFESEDESSKVAMLNRMAELRGTILALKDQVARDSGDLVLAAQLDAARNEYRSLSESLGGDEPGTTPAGGFQPLTLQSAIALDSFVTPASVASTPPGCSSAANTFSNNTPVTITSLNTFTSNITVSSAGSYLWDLDLQTSITHTFNGDLDITLTSPSGNVVTVTTDNGGSNDNVFNGTVWDDQATTPVTDFGFSNGVTAASLQIEESFGRLIGENPNGVWTLSITDDTLLNTGTLSNWSLTLTTLASAPVQSTAAFTNSTSTPINDSPTVTSQITVSGAGTSMLEVALVTNITHTDNDDLDITLTSPTGTVVTITTDNADDDNDVFDGTVWDDDADAANPPGPVTDTDFDNNVTEVTLCPEGSMAAFNGADPNGTWTLTIDDDASGDTGSLSGWSLIITTADCQSADTCLGTTQTFSNSTAAAISSITPPVVQTVTVSGAGSYLLDLNLTTFITHNNNADIDMTLTSPSGTVVTITTDNGGSDNDVFNGTLWDDQADPDGQVPYSSNNGLVTDHNYSNNVVASPLVPEEAMGAFIGENPNGAWTLTISDDNLNGNTGTLSSWSIDVTSLSAAPTGTTTSFSNSGSQSILSFSPVTSGILVSGAGSKLGTIRVTTNISHTNSEDLDVTLTSPSGRIVTLTTDNGGNDNDVFEGTLWDDKGGATNPPGAATDNSYANNVVETPLVPEEALAAFNGENPNGIWTLTIDDDSFNGATGDLNSWSIEITTITCCQPPAVSDDTEDQTVCAGDSVSFTATATGNPTPTVQWEVSTDGGSTFANLPGETSTTLSFTAGSSQDGHMFRAVFTNSCGTATTSAAELTVNTAPSITQNPTDQGICASSMVTFTAAASGSPAPTVQWQTSTDGGSTFADLMGETNTTLSFTGSAAQDGHKFRAVFTNVCGTATTTAAMLMVGTAPSVTTNPVDQTVCSGNTVNFTAAASGMPAPTVQWQVSTNGGTTFNNVPGATSLTLSFTAAASQNGHKFRAVFTNSCGSATSTAATLTVNVAPAITLSPISQISISSSPVTFTAAASGSPTPTVQWQVSTNGGATFNNIPGATNPSLTFTPTPAQHGHLFRAVFTNVCGSATTAVSGSFGALQVYDQCIEQFIDSGRRILMFNSVTGHYRYLYCRKNVIITGQGSVTIRLTPDECKIELKDFGANPKKPDRTILAIVNPCTKAGSATVQVPAAAISHTITDPNTTDNSCMCPTP